MTVPVSLSVSILIKKLLWASCLLIFASIALDGILGLGQRMARGVALGSLLVVLIQSSFAYLSFKAKLTNKHNIDTRPANQVLMSMTVALLVKWALMVAGFVLIFKLPMRISYPAVFAGFFLMQMFAMGVLVRFRAR